MRGIVPPLFMVWWRVLYLLLVRVIRLKSVTVQCVHSVANLIHRLYFCGIYIPEKDKGVV